MQLCVYVRVCVCVRARMFLCARTHWPDLVCTLWFVLRSTGIFLCLPSDPLCKAPFMNAIFPCKVPEDFVNGVRC